MPDYKVKQGDTAPFYQDALTYSDGSAVDLNGATVTLQMRSLANASLTTLTGTVTVVNPFPASLTYAPSAADTAVPGNFQANWVVVFGNGKQMTFPTDGYLWFTVQPNLASVPQQLVSLDEVKEYLNIGTTSRERDSKLISYIEAVTPLIEQITGPMVPKAYEEWHDGGANIIELLRKPATGFGTSPVLQLIAVSEYRGPIEYPLALVASPTFGSIYSVMLNPDMGTVTRRTAGGRTLAFMPGRESVHILYRSGQNPIPANVVEAAKELIRVNYETTQQVGAGRRTVADEMDMGMRPFFMPNRVRELLGPTRRAPSFA